MRGNRNDPARVIAALAVATCVCASGCFEDDDAMTPGDTIPPAAVTDLAVASVTDSSVTLGWTAPGDDGDQGRAAAYDLRYALGAPAVFLWEQLSPVPSPPLPLPAGARERFSVEGLFPDTAYSFVLRSLDDERNPSDLSNLVFAWTDGVWTPTEIEPSALDFDTLIVGTWREREFTITNVGIRPLAGSVSSRCPSFAVMRGGGDYNLSPGQRRTVRVRYGPLVVGTHTCTVVTGLAGGGVACTGVAESGARCRVEPDTLAFPDTPMGSFSELEFTVANVGATGVLSGSPQGSNPRFHIAPGQGYRLGPGDRAGIRVRFQPIDAGFDRCEIDPGTGCGPVYCVGYGLDIPPVCEVEPTELVFAPTRAGGSQDARFTVRNLGGGVLAGPAMSDCADFHIVPATAEYSLGARQSHVVVVRYMPIGIGPDACRVSSGNPLCPGVTCNIGSRDPGLSCYFADFDDDGDPWTLRTEVFDQRSATFDFIIEVGDPPPLGRSFSSWIDVHCRDLGDQWSVYECWAVQIEEVTYDSTYVRGDWGYGAGRGCTDDQPIMQWWFRPDAPLVPHERCVIASGKLWPAGPGSDCGDLPQYIRFPVIGPACTGAEPALWFTFRDGLASPADLGVER